MKYAIISLAGGQHKISEGTQLSVNKIDGEVGEKLTLDQVNLIVDGDKITIGTPVVKKASVQAAIVEQFKDTKVRVAKFKAKSRYRVVNGFRAQKTKIVIEKINS